jgi:hypothetical protein
MSMGHELDNHLTTTQLSAITMETDPSEDDFCESSSSSSSSDSDCPRVAKYMRMMAEREADDSAFVQTMQARVAAVATIASTRR